MEEFLRWAAQRTNLGGLNFVRLGKAKSGLGNGVGHAPSSSWTQQGCDRNRKTPDGFRSKSRKNQWTMVVGTCSTGIIGSGSSPSKRRCKRGGRCSNGGHWDWGNLMTYIVSDVYTTTTSAVVTIMGWEVTVSKRDCVSACGGGPPRPCNVRYVN